MTSINHFQLSSALGSRLGPRVAANHGQLGSSELASTLAALLARRQSHAEDLISHSGITRQYESAVKRAFLAVRNGYSPDRVLADPSLDRKFLKTCRDMGLDDDEFRLNLTLLYLRKSNKLPGLHSKRTTLRNQWQYATASEVAARTMYYRFGLSVDSLICHPVLVANFDEIAKSLAPGFASFEYRWAALNMRKKGTNAVIKPAALKKLDWSKSHRFESNTEPPAHRGIFSVAEEATPLLVGGTENLKASIESQRHLLEAPLFDRNLWHPDAHRLTWRYVSLPETSASVRYGIVNELIAEWQPIFNIPRGDGRLAA